MTRARTAEGWTLRGAVENAGNGRMTAALGATAGERRSDEGDDASRTVVRGDYRDAGATVSLGAGESADFEIVTDFAPERNVVDPDVLVLRLRRAAGRRSMGAARSARDARTVGRKIPDRDPSAAAGWMS